MPLCTECNSNFDVVQDLRDHINATHKRLFCPMCKGGPYIASGLTLHARAKHSKKCWKILYTCRTCSFYHADPAQLRQHYRTSTMHKCCSLCEEPFYDLPMPNSPVLYLQDANLRHCVECGRRTLSRKVMTSAASHSSSESDLPVDMGRLSVADDLETTVGGYY